MTDPTGRQSCNDNPDCPGGRAAQSAAARAAYVGIRSDQVRGQYNRSAASLAIDDSAGRSAIKDATRAATPPEVRAGIEARRPGLGPSEGSGGTANRTNAGATQAARNLGNLGRVAGGVAVVTAGADIATSDDPGRAAVANTFSIGGAILGGEAGATAGLYTGPAAPVASPVLGLLGAIGGGLLGYEGGDALMSGQRDSSGFNCGETLGGCGP